MRSSGEGRGDDQAPYFFLSYAHTPRAESTVPDPDLWVGRLYRDLVDHVLALTDLGHDAAVGFMDRDIRSGEGWSERLAESLATCRVFVPLFSPRYFNSAECGKEWYAFAQRAVQEHARSNRSIEAIVPALWVPVPPQQLPGAAERLQFSHMALGDPYTTEGLYGLIKLTMFRSAYELAVYELAKRIVKVAQSSGVRPGQPVDYRRIPSAFGRSRGPRSLRITVAAGVRGRLPSGRSAEFYGDHADEWNPFHPASSRPLSEVAAELARSFDYEPVVTALDEEPGREPDADEPGAEILVVDRWAVTDPELSSRLAAYDRARPFAAVLVAVNSDDEQTRDTEADFAARLVSLMPRCTSQGPPACRTAARGVQSLAALTDLLPQVVEWSAAQRLRHAPTRPPNRSGRVRLFGPGDADPPGTAHPDSPDDPEEPR